MEVELHLQEIDEQLLEQIDYEQMLIEEEYYLLFKRDRGNTF